MRTQLILLLALVPAACRDTPRQEQQQLEASGGEYPPAIDPPADAERWAVDRIDRLVLREYDGIAEAIAMTPDGRTRNILRAVRGAVAGAEEIVVSRDNTLAAVLVTTGSGEQDIYVVNLEDPDDVVRVTTVGMTGIREIFWSSGAGPPTLHFLANKDGETDLWTARADGTELRILAGSVRFGIVNDPLGRIFYRRGTELYAIDAEGNETHISTEGPPAEFPSFAVGPGGIVLYEKGELYREDGTRISTESGTTGPIAADKIEFDRGGKWAVYARERAASGFTAGFLVDLERDPPQPERITPDVDLDLREFRFDPIGRYIYLRLGSGALFVHEIGAGTHLITDEGDDGIVANVQFSADGNAIAFGAAPDRFDPLRAYLGGSDGRGLVPLDGAGEEGGRHGVFLPGKQCFLHAVRMRVGFDASWILREWRTDFPAVPGVVESGGEWMLPADLNVVGLDFHPDRVLASDDPRRGVSIEYAVDDYRLSGSWTGSDWRVFPLGVAARTTRLPNVEFVLPRLGSGAFGATFLLDVRYDDGAAPYTKIAAAEVDEDGDARWYEWLPQFNLLRGYQFFGGTVSVPNRRIELDEPQFGGRTTVDFHSFVGASSAPGLFAAWIRGDPAVQSAEYDPDPSAAGLIYLVNPMPVQREDWFE